MADKPKNSLTRTRGRNCHRDNCVNVPTNNTNFQDYVGAETITIRNSNRSAHSNGRRGGNSRNRVSSSNVRNSFDRMQHRRFEPSFNTRLLQSGNNELNGDGSENNEDGLQISSDNNLNSTDPMNQQSSTSTKSNNNIGSLINRNFPNIEDDSDCLRQLPQSSKDNAKENGIAAIPTNSDLDEDEQPPPYTTQDGTPNIPQAPGNLWQSRGSENGICNPITGAAVHSPVYNLTRTYTPRVGATAKNSPVLPPAPIENTKENGIPHTVLSDVDNNGDPPAYYLSQNSTITQDGSYNLPQAHGILWRSRGSKNGIYNPITGAAVHSPVYYRARNYASTQDGSYNLPQAPGSLWQPRGSENGICNPITGAAVHSPVYNRARNYISYAQDLYNLPKGEVNLSPTRVPSSSSSGANNHEVQQTSATPTSPTDKFQGATSADFHMKNIPSTSNSSEVSEVTTQAITKRHSETPESWINAPEFHPKSVNACNPPLPPTPNLNGGSDSERVICPMTLKGGDCRMLPYCPYMHGELCDLCNCTILHPTDKELRMRHRQQCVERHEKNMELSFAIARSKEKTCGICFEVVVEKESYDRRFGILNQCNHCFCLTCIRRWRQARQFEHKVVKACPECRVTSDFVCPSQYWVETKEEKEMLIESYKKVLANKACKYFKQGRGVCPFGNKCFYLHALPDGTKTDVGPPRRRTNNRASLDERIFGDLSRLMLWDISADFEHHWLYSLAEDVEDLAAFFSDSDESDGADYEFFFP